MAKTNPRKRHATEADVRKAWFAGINEGVSNACAIFLTVLVDKFNGAEHIEAVWQEINKLSEEVEERRVSVADLRQVLLDEYGIHI